MAERTTEWDIAADIRAERARRNLRQADVAELAGLDQSTVSDVENGKASPQAIEAVARALGVSL